MHTDAVIAAVGAGVVAGQAVEGLAVLVILRNTHAVLVQGIELAVSGAAGAGCGGGACLAGIGAALAQCAHIIGVVPIVT